METQSPLYPCQPLCLFSPAHLARAGWPHDIRGVFQDFFFYSLVYDPQQKTLLADKGEIRVGNRYQADVTDLLQEGRAW